VSLRLYKEAVELPRGNACRRRLAGQEYSRCQLASNGAKDEGIELLEKVNKADPMMFRHCIPFGHDSWRSNKSMPVTWIKLNKEGERAL